MQAVVKIGTTQYLVKEGTEVLAPKNAKLESILLAFDDNQVLVGTPTLSNVKVTVDNLGEIKGDKVKVSKFKAKSRYRKNTGFRPVFTKLKVKSISSH